MDKKRNWTIRELLNATSEYLAGKGIDNPRLNAEVLLSHILQMERIELYLDLEKPLSEKELSDYRQLIRRRVNREPLHYITGKREFWSLEFKVTPEVLIPRPETEILVEEIIGLLKKEGLRRELDVHVLELGAGSGAISISVSKEFQGVIICATDISEDAIRIARENAVSHHVDERLIFIVGDLFHPFSIKRARFQIIVSNPPYIPSHILDTLQPEVRDHEPRMALNGGENGLEIIKRIIMDCPPFLLQGGWLIIEMDPGQIKESMEFLEQTKAFGSYKVKRDWSNKDRVLMAQKI